MRPPLVGLGCGYGKGDRTAQSLSHRKGDRTAQSLSHRKGDRTDSSFGGILG
jgi:hypothetical protein